MQKYHDEPKQYKGYLKSALERKVRKQVVVHLSMSGNRLDVPYSVLLISLVKDVERIGDYAKNLSEIVDIRPAVLAEDEITLELQEIRRGVEDAFEALSGVFASSDRERAVDLIEQRRDAAHRCDALIERIALSDYDARIATACIGNPLLQTDRRSRPQHPVERRHADPQDRLLRRGRNARREAVVNKATSPG